MKKSKTWLYKKKPTIIHPYGRAVLESFNEFKLIVNDQPIESFLKLFYNDTYNEENNLSLKNMRAFLENCEKKKD